MCGEDARLVPGAVRVEGRSPRVRGRLGVLAEDLLVVRSIPACAGKTQGRCVTRTNRRVDPRVCGEDSPVRVPHRWIGGRSPRVRGRPRGNAQVVVHKRSIPACAGKTAMKCVIQTHRVVDPRVCGEDSPRRAAGSVMTGRSPRVRGRPEATGFEGRLCGSIPACAGKTPARSFARRIIRVDPRVCGEDVARAVIVAFCWGRSPRVRGRLDRCPVERLDARSIPACAGKTSAPHASR